MNPAALRHWTLGISHWSFARILPVFLLALCVLALATPLALDDAIQLALQHNQRIKVSEFSPQIARANVLTAYGTFDPAITFRRSYSETETPGPLAPFARRSITQTDNYSLSLDGLMPWGMSYSLGGTATNLRGNATPYGFADNYTTFGGVSVTQPLLRGFGFGATLANLRVAKASRGISDWQHRQTVIDIVTNVIFSFNNLQQARANLKIARDSRGLTAQLLDETEKKNRVGAVADADVVQTRAQLATREESILLAERRIRDAENQLRLLVGDTGFGTSGPDLEIVELAPAAEISVDASTDVKKALDLRPDYQAARLGITIDRANNAAAQNALLPRLDFVGSYGYSGVSGNFRTARDQVRDEDARSYSAGMVVRVPLTFADGRGRARAARLNLRQGEADLVRLEQDIAIAVTAAAGQIETTRQRVAVTRIARDLAAQALDSEQKKFRAGTGRTLDILSLQGSLSSADNSYASALADQRRALATYERELGVTLVSHQIALK